jgi:hypothetical protein
LRKQWLEEVMVQSVTRLTERLGADHAYPVGAVGQVGEEGVEFRLDGAGQAGEQEGDDGGERQPPVAGKEVGLQARGVEEIL